MSSYSYTKGGPYSPGGSMTSANANNIEQGVDDAHTFKLDKDGSVANTGTQDFSRTLGGSDKTFATFTASDGKQYSLLERNSDKALVFKNLTDSIVLLVMGPTAGTLKMDTSTVWHSGNDGSGSGLDADTVDGVNAASLALVGAHSAGQTVISYGNGAPGALAANEIYVQLT